MYTLTITHPERTMAGRLRFKNCYSVTSVHGTSARKLTTNQFCQEQGLSLSGLFRVVRLWGAGTYDDEFRELVAKMKANKRGTYAKNGNKFMCPCGCGHVFTREESLFAKRRLARDNSPLNHSLRFRDPTYFGEPAGTPLTGVLASQDVGAAETATPEAVSH